MFIYFYASELFIYIIYFLPIIYVIEIYGEKNKKNNGIYYYLDSIGFMSMFFFYIVEKKFLKSNVETQIIVFRDSTLLKNKKIKKPFPFRLLGCAIIFYICYMISSFLLKDLIISGYYSDIVFFF